MQTQLFAFKISYKLWGWPNTHFIGVKRYLQIFLLCYFFCLPFLSMLFSTLFPTTQNLISSNYASNNLCLSAESTSQTMKQGVSTAPFQLGEIPPIGVSNLMQYIFRSNHRCYLDFIIPFPGRINL